MIEGLVRVGIFLGYLVLISQMRDIKRVFQYHGAEHMTIHALEATTRSRSTRSASTRRPTSAAAPSSWSS